MFKRRLRTHLFHCTLSSSLYTHWFVFMARCYASEVLAMGLCPCLSVCLSVGLSQAGVLLKQLNTGSHKQHHMIVQDSSFLMPKISAKFDRGHPLRVRRMQVWWVKIGDFQQITGYISKTAKDRHIVSIKSNRNSYALEWWHCPWPWVPPNRLKQPHFLYFAPPFIASQRVNLETSNLAHWLNIASPTLPIKNLPWKGRGQGQLTHFRILHPM